MEQLTAQQEAKELVDKMMLYSYEKKEDYYTGFHNQKKDYIQYTVDYKIKKEHAIQCALIALEGRMEELCILPYGMEYLDRLAYLEEIKEEINKL